MSALGQNRTFHVAVRESALPTKADIWVQCSNVRLVPIADILPPLDFAISRLPPMPGAIFEKNTARLLGGRYGLKVFITRVDRASSVGAYNGALQIGAESHSAHQGAWPAGRRTKRTSAPTGSISLHNVSITNLFASILETNTLSRVPHHRNKLLGIMPLPGIEIGAAGAAAKHQ